MQRLGLQMALLATAVLGGLAASVSPINKVIQLLDGMLTKGKQQKHEEQVQYAAYKQFCDDTKIGRERSIQEADEAIEVLKADIQKHVSDASRLTKEISGHDSDTAAWTGDKKAAAKVREIEKADYEAMHTDYGESIDALRRAVAHLKKFSHDRPQASLAQVKALKALKLIPEQAKKTLELFFAQSNEEPLPSAPDANAYEFQSHGIIDLLEKLQDKFFDERTEQEKKEMNTRHAFELLSQDLQAQLEAATQDRSEKAVWKSKALQAKADAEGSLGDTSATRQADDAYLTDLTGTCGQKASDFKVRQVLRTDELQAIERALEILKGDMVGAGLRRLPALAQARKGPSHAQLRAGSSHGSPVQVHAAAYLARQARALNSKVLSVLATKVADDPFAKVKTLIRDLITRLMEEANQEAEHKGWCDTELSTNAQTRKEKTTSVEVLHAEIDQLEASIAFLGEKLGELSGAVADLERAMAEATKLRFEEKAENERTVKDAQDAQAAVAEAVAVLREYYAKAAESTVLVQSRKQPSIFDSPYQGMQAENAGVIGMLEVVQSDFARLEADTLASEAVAQKTYDQLMTNSKVDKAQKTKEIEHQEAKRQDQSQALTTKSSDLHGAQNELDAALSYYDKLKPSCVDSGSSYDSRVARRKEEIESLQEALRILNGEDIAL